MKHKARVMITLDCNRSCDGCCNTGQVFDDHTEIESLSELGSFDEILITGGEPLLNPSRLIAILEYLRKRNPASLIYLYSALFNQEVYRDMFRNRLIDGLHFTLHYECNDHDVAMLKSLSYFLAKGYVTTPSSVRLAIDARLYDRYDFSNIDFSGWGSVRKLVWLEDCPLPEGEELFLLRGIM